MFWSIKAFIDKLVCKVCGHSPTKLVGWVGSHKVVYCKRCRKFVDAGTTGSDKVKFQKKHVE